MSPSRHSVLAALSCLAPTWLVLIAAGGLPARADVFLLGSGGKVEGEWINADEQPLTQFLVRTNSGVVLKLEAGQVKEHLRPSPAEQQYELLAPTFPNTVGGHWQLALWCRQHGLTAQRRNHLERILDLDPNHRQSRALLGYAFIGGQWVTESRHKRQQGLEYYRGQWRTPQEIELLEKKSKQELLEKEWQTKLQRWRKMLDSDKAKSAYQSLRSIRDPLAVAPLIEMFKRERVRSVKRLYADVLANIDSRDAVGFLVHASLHDRDIEIFYYCLDKLLALQVPRLADEYVDALRDADNGRVNRAAAALDRIGDRAAISPLIDALITVHQRTLPGRLGPDATAATFSADGNSSITQGEGPKVQIVRVQNQPVLEALSRLSGASFGFDQKAWRYWYNQELQAEARRGTNTLLRQD